MLNSEVSWYFPPLTFLQLVLHNHQEGNANHEKVEAEAHLAELTYGSPAHLTHHILVRLLPADRRGMTKNNQPTDEEHQRNLKKNKSNVTHLKGKQSSWWRIQVLSGSIIRANMWNVSQFTPGWVKWTWEEPPNIKVLNSHQRLCTSSMCNRSTDNTS